MLMLLTYLFEFFTLTLLNPLDGPHTCTMYFLCKGDEAISKPTVYVTDERDYYQPRGKHSEPLGLDVFDEVY